MCERTFIFLRPYTNQVPSPGSKGKGGKAMKRILIGVLTTTMLFIASSGAAVAQEGAGVEVGLKMWINDWTHDDPVFGSTTSDTTVLLGPAIKAKFGEHVFGEASFLFSTADYNFPDTGQHFDRQDVDLAIGFMIIPEFGVLAGYKDTSLREKLSGTKDTVFGPVIGVVGDFPMDPYFSFYGRLDYLFTRFKEEGGGLPTFEEDSPGWIFEFGLKFAFTREFTGSLGYKYETNEGNDTAIRDTFSGLTLGAMFTF